MIVLGISATYDHDSAAALVCDGELMAAVEEERLSRVKHDGAPPLGAIERCLAIAGVRWEDVDRIAIPHLPYRFGRDSYVAAMRWDDLRRWRRSGAATWRPLLNRALVAPIAATGLPLNLGCDRVTRTLLAAVAARFGPLPPRAFFDHHLAHAAASVLTSGADDAAAVTADGFGGPYSSVAWRARGGALERVAAELFPDSLGNFYEDITRHLGLGAFGEGKAMGLAPYGDPSRFERAMATLLPRDGERAYRYARPELATALGFPTRSAGPLLDGPYADAAAAAQRALEDALGRFARAVATDDATLCLGGGVALNCTANGVLRRAGLAREVWVFPAAGDAGLSVGAALLAANAAGAPRPRRLRDACLGAAATEAACVAALEQEPRLEFRRSADAVAETAVLLAAGSVVGWHQGRSEFGPRALGHRSILADPRRIATRDRVNRLKGREHWRPLAPSVLAEHAAGWFELEGESPFMLFAAPVRAACRAEVPAVVHVDGSARPQTVSAAQDARYHALLAEFERLSGVPMLLNTSFNDEREPIVETPADAVRCFLSCGLDALVLGDLIATRRDLPAGAVPGADRPVVR